VIAVELQGHGHTADIEREMTLLALAEDVMALLYELGVERADLSGFSLGGMTALETALRYPERVDRVVLASVNFRPDGYLDEICNPALHAGRIGCRARPTFRRWPTPTPRSPPIRSISRT
jgi:pimeloyl-ACP methyl ester carboxylesterase